MGRLLGLGAVLFRSLPAGAADEPPNQDSTMKALMNTLTDRQVDLTVQLAWHDRTSFDELRERTGLTEADVIRLMRRELAPRSFRLWRKRVRGRVTKHRKLLKAQLKRIRLADEEALG